MPICPNPKFPEIPSRRAQIQLTFNWVFILIAGAVILLFFVGLVVKQKAAAEQQLGTDVVRIMESIFVGAGVSEKTKNSIDASGLIDYTLEIGCEDGVGQFSIKGKGERRQNALDPIFAPLELKATRLSLWSLPYKLPFKVIDFLFVTSENTKYFLIGDDPFIAEFLNETEPDEKAQFRINREHLAELSAIDPGRNYQVRVVDVSGNAVQENVPVPPLLERMDDTLVTAVVFRGLNQVQYYQKQGSVWHAQGLPVFIVSLAGKRDAAKYAAIFAGNGKVYECNMQKAFRRLEYLNEIYGGDAIAVAQPGGKLGDMLEYYVRHQELSSMPVCKGYLQAFPNENMVVALGSHQNSVKACLRQPSSCVDLIRTGKAIADLNGKLATAGDCLTLY